MKNKRATVAQGLKKILLSKRLILQLNIETGYNVKGILKNRVGKIGENLKNSQGKEKV